MPLELNPEVYRAVLESLPIGVYLTDRKRQIAFWNTSAERITGYLAQEVIGHFCPDNLLMHCDENQLALCGSACPLAQTMQDGRAREANIFLRHKEGQRVPVRVRSVPVRDEFGVIIGAAECFEERSFRAVEKRCPHLRGEVWLDDVTEIPDRRTTLAALDAVREAFAGSQVPFGVLSIAVDNLDHLRRTSGCQAVNTVFYAVAQTLSGGTRPDDLVGRWREDRFLALVACPAAEGLLSCAERLKRLVSLAAVPWWGDRLSVTVSLGGTMVRPGDTAESLLERAEKALESATAARVDSVLVI
ncbi:MAG: diguanylate cyclase [Bryobacteraceae bacterium]|jgi:diguanylate cyclase (GGDEF)-like protein/PAS domain S-box-containing protein